jgi:hypothetical protein
LEVTLATIIDRIETIENNVYRAADAPDARLDAFTVAYFVAGNQSGSVTLRQLFVEDERHGGVNPYTRSGKRRWYDGGQLVRQAKPTTSGDLARGRWYIDPERQDATFALTADACSLARSILADLQRQNVQTIEDLTARMAGA